MLAPMPAPAGVPMLKPTTADDRDRRDRGPDERDVAGRPRAGEAVDEAGARRRGRLDVDEAPHRRGPLFRRADDLAPGAGVHLGEERVDLVVGHDPAAVLVDGRPGLRGRRGRRCRRGGDDRGGSRSGSVPVDRRCRRSTGTDGRSCARPDEGDGAGERGRVREKCVRLVGARGLGPGPATEALRRRSEVHRDRLVGGGDVLAGCRRIEPEARQELALQLLGRDRLAVGGGGHGHGAAPAGRALMARGRSPVIGIALVLGRVHARTVLTPASKCRDEGAAIPSAGGHKCAAAHAFGR